MNDVCRAATETCPTPEQTRYWVARMLWDPARSAYGDWVLQPGSVCLTREQLEAVADPTAAIVGAVRADWREFGLPAATVTTLPAGQTLVGAVTKFATPTPLRATLPPKTVLGFPVTLTVTATRYVWDFGDGESLSVAATAAAQSVEHVYRVPGDKQVTVRTFYTATFTVPGTGLTDEPLDGVAEVPGVPTVLDAAEARTQLEAGPRG